MLKEIVIAFQSWSEAHRFIQQHKLWKWIVIPGIIYTILFVVGIYFFWASADDAVSWVSEQMRIENWLQQKRSEWLSFFFVMMGMMLRLVLVLFYFSLFKYIILIIGSPVFAYLSEKTEAIIDNKEYSFNWKELKNDAKRSIRMALRNCLGQTIYLVGLVLMSLLPLVVWITPVIALLMECYYFGFSMLDYSFARNAFTPQQSFLFIGRHKGLAIGNGILFYLMHIVIIFAPAYAIVAATLSVHKVKKQSIMDPKGIVYLIPSLLDENGLEVIPSYILPAVKDCQVFFVENERTARRYLKQLWKEMVIDDYEWFTIHKAEEGVQHLFKEKLNEGKHIGIISEAGCPGVADPGQLLVSVAQDMNAAVRPLVGPSSILLALMASGMNGQQFQFTGYLPIDNQQRIKAIKELEAESQKKNCTQIFIETPYRNNQLVETLVKNCKSSTRLCIAADLTGKTEWISTKTMADWKKEKVDIHKRPAIFLLLAFTT